MIPYLKTNLLRGFATSPLRRWPVSLGVTLVFALIAFGVGHLAGLYTPGTVEPRLMAVLPFTLFVFPSLLEEAFFRGVLIPRNTYHKRPARIGLVAFASAIAFTIWHPLNALTINPGARSLFLDPAFLAIVFCLGLVCAFAYIASRSLWVPVGIHWLTVLVWVLFLGGRNLVLG